MPNKNSTPLADIDLARGNGRQISESLRRVPIEDGEVDGRFNTTGTCRVYRQNGKRIPEILEEKIRANK